MSLDPNHSFFFVPFLFCGVLEEKKEVQSSSSLEVFPRVENPCLIDQDKKESLQNEKMETKPQDSNQRVRVVSSFATKLLKKTTEIYLGLLTLGSFSIFCLTFSTPSLLALGSLGLTATIMSAVFMFALKKESIRQEKKEIKRSALQVMDHHSLFWTEASVLLKNVEKKIEDNAEIFLLKINEDRDSVYRSIQEYLFADGEMVSHPSSLKKTKKFFLRKMNTIYKTYLSDQKTDVVQALKESLKLAQENCAHHCRSIQAFQREMDAKEVAKIGEEHREALHLPLEVRPKTCNF